MSSVLLECFHTLDLSPPPKIGDELWCRYCRAATKVAKGADAWSIRCTGCRHGRSYGTDEGQARRSAVKHANKTGHPVLVKEGRVWRATVDGKGASLPEAETVNDWTKKNPGHQGGLRTLLNRDLR
jgi:hypothetical protein